MDLCWRYHGRVGRTRYVCPQSQRVIRPEGRDVAALAIADGQRGIVQAVVAWQLVPTSRLKPCGTGREKIINYAADRGKSPHRSHRGGIIEGLKCKV